MLNETSRFLYNLLIDSSVKISCSFSICDELDRGVVLASSVNVWLFSFTESNDSAGVMSDMYKEYFAM